MEILNVTYKCKEGMREKFLETIKAEGLDAASRACFCLKSGVMQRLSKVTMQSLISNALAS